jgi:aspartate/methionine/tyrosine aminotransferase
MTPTGRLAARVADLRPSATLAVDARAKALAAAGEAVIGFGAGEPDFPTPEPIVAAAAAACADPRNHRYTPTAGLPELRAAIAAKTERDSGFAPRPEEVLVTNGGKHAVANACWVLLDPGDEVLLPAPYWTTYPEAIRLAGGVPVEVPTSIDDGYRVDPDRLEAARTGRTKAVVFVSPSNPTGVVYPPEEVAAIGRWAAERGLWVITDEIYEHLTFGSHRFSSLPGLVPEARDRCLVLNGVAKTYAMTGWRVGWMIGPADVVEAAVNLQSHTTSNVANVSQRAALAALESGLEAVAEMRAAFERRAKVMHAGLSAIEGVRCLEPQGAFYCFPDLTDVLGRPVGDRVPTTSVELAEALLEVAKVAVVPGEAFGAPGHARLSFALADEACAEGVARIAEALAR